MSLIKALEKHSLSRGDWLWKPANFKYKNNDVAVCVENSLRVHSPVFLAHKSWLNKFMRLFFICGKYQKHRTRWLNVVHRRVQWKPTKQKQRNLTGFMTIPPYLLWLQRSVFYWAKNIFYYVKHANDFSNANSKLRQKAIGTEGFSVSCSFIARWFYRSPYHDSHLSPNFTFLFRIHWWA